MKVSELIKHLDTMPPELEVVVSLDEVGKRVAALKLNACSQGLYYAEDADYFDVEVGDTPNAVCLWPNLEPLIEKEGIR